MKISLEFQKSIKLWVFTHSDTRVNCNYYDLKHGKIKLDPKNETLLDHEVGCEMASLLSESFDGESQISLKMLQESEVNEKLQFIHQNNLQCNKSMNSYTLTKIIKLRMSGNPVDQSY